MQSEPATPRTVSIIITVTHFQPIGAADSCSRATFRLGGGADKGVEILEGRDDFVIQVKARVDLEFRFSDAGGKSAYWPLGIAFREVSRNGAEAGATHGDARLVDPVGFGAFPIRHVALSGRTAFLTVRDENPRAAEFIFELFIQHPDGRTGRIDPKVRNIGVPPN